MSRSSKVLLIGLLSLLIVVPTGRVSATVSNSIESSVTYDIIPLTVTINQADDQLDPTNALIISFTVVFSDITTDFATGDVTLSGTALPTTTTVTGSGTTYNVAVSGMTMNGTVIASIAEGVAHDATNNANLASSSTDNTVTYDTIAPSFSAIAPAPSTFISSITGTTSAVSYTLSETVASGSITITQTGGTADPSSPHICTLKGVALFTGSHNNLDLSDITNACTNAQSLVSGAVYTFAFNGVDAAGNPAPTVTSTNVTFDNTGPVFSAVTPVTNAFIKSITGTTSAVSYTLSKDIASGSITMTQTGGLGDPGSPHICTLKGTALLQGAHTNLNLSNTTNSCTVTQSLVSGAVYTFAFNGVDAAGNPAPTITSTDVTFDSTFPTLSWIAPVSSGLTYYVGNQTVQLAVNASDNVGVTQVVFSRWDSVNSVRVPIGTLTSPTILPSTYNLSFDTSTLLPGYNEIDVKVVDGTGNTTQDYIWLYHLPIVTVTKMGSGTGTVTSNPPGIDCGLTCSYGFANNTVVTLIATPTPPSVFAGWGGACSGTGTCTLTMDADKAVTANFSPAITISGNGGVADAIITYTGGSTTTNSSGDYLFTISYGWSGTVTPSKMGYTFSPTNRQYTNVQTNLTAQDYTATANTLIYLPLVIRNWPPIPIVPTLNQIDNSDQNNSYTVTWNNTELATAYLLQESTDVYFSNPKAVYNGPNISWQVPAPGKTPSTYYYRLKAINSFGESAWSNIQSVTIYPLFIGLNLQWDGMGYIRGSEYYDVGWHKTRNLDLLSQGYIIRSNNHEWYDPNPYNWAPTDWLSYYSVTSGEFLSSSVPDDPSWKWGEGWILPYNSQFHDGQTVYIGDQAFIVSGPHFGYTAFGAPIQYWEFVNRDQFLYWDGGGDWKQYVYQGDIVLRYDAGNTKLEIYSNILRHYFYQGNPTSDTVQYIMNLTASGSFPGSASLFESLLKPTPHATINNQFETDISLLPGSQY